MFAGAAFTDEADINAANKEAVDTLVALGVINGYKDGSFQPNATITRAEMAKMIYVLRTGSDNADAHKNANTTFTDVNGTWGAGYIKYCQALGIIAGKSATKFAPDETVTGQEAAKMLLVTLGYDATKVGLVGHGWGQKAVALADENSLLEDVNAALTLALPRGDAAQMMYNAVNAHTVKMTDGEYSNMNIVGTYYPTVGEKYMGLKKTTSVLSDVEKDGSTYNLTLVDDDDVIDWEDTTYSMYNASNVKKDYITNFTKVTNDYTALKNQKVRVLYKASNNVYGVYAVEDGKVSNGTLGSMEKDGSKLKVNGTKYSVAAKADVKVDDAYVVQGDTELLEFVDKAEGLKKAYNASAISNTSSGKINLLDVQSVVIAQVTYVGSDYINVSFKSTKIGDVKTKLTDDDATWYKDIAKDDYVAITSNKVNADDNYGVTKLDVVTGKVTSSKNSNTAQDYQVKIDGTWYEMAIDNKADFKDMNAGSTVSIVVKDGYCVAVDDLNASVDDVALAIEIGKTSGVGSGWQADLLFTDGTRETVSLKSGDEIKKGSTQLSTSDLATLDAKDDSDPFLVSYSKSSGKYKLTIMDSTNKAGYDTFASEVTADGSNTIKNNRFTKGDVKLIDDNATVLVRYDDGDSYRVITGKTMKGWSDSTKIYQADILADKSNGSNYTKLAYVNLGKKSSIPGGADTLYAYLFSGPEYNDDDDDSYYEYDAWNGSDVKIKITEDEEKSVLDEGTVIEYNLDSDGFANIENKWTPSELTHAAVTGGDLDKDLTGSVNLSTDGKNVNTYDIDEDNDPIVLFIDMDGESGVVQSSFTEAEEDAKGYIANAVFAFDETDTSNIKVLIVDVGDNNIYESKVYGTR
ncbi:S-layer homology domain-containing protein [Agathobaculum sp. NTUH-O15-33]|uniref:S-layer homology domain-containing protein n=1 Tax=Agathobaculum sp. NTUH-O15-33 TaxID=3079302 RepID=UPI0029584CB3|nr:S-layer homology domain-containing protein [Agathobaculum sp. NTUH-O15-33]WNX85174.1 S-layer homology domain-containing protein [Agathobaculum sp. NTUH-O15-33]